VAAGGPGAAPAHGERGHPVLVPRPSGARSLRGNDRRGHPARGAPFCQGSTSVWVTLPPSRLSGLPLSRSTRRITQPYSSSNQSHGAPGPGSLDSATAQAAKAFSTDVWTVAGLPSYSATNTSAPSPSAARSRLSSLSAVFLWAGGTDRKSVV